MASSALAKSYRCLTFGLASPWTLTCPLTRQWYSMPVFSSQSGWPDMSCLPKVSRHRSLIPASFMLLDSLLKSSSSADTGLPL